jgi:hypothetical protein
VFGTRAWRARSVRCTCSEWYCGLQLARHRRACNSSPGMHQPPGGRPHLSANGKHVSHWGTQERPITQTL